ncbi:hypothetical protein LPJ66_004016 [Kickxella alabastrina]|uniref:Uncharacterized protein n=1 Tax=Kickxella alabastrina TaxID=61397 RepID=A0ACC1IIR3_9FUNG|nr:hypothetical protein LPJ66_004016 [Kickxella alabastrina]
MSTLQFSNYNAAAVAAEQQQSNDDIVNDKAAGKCASPSRSSSCEKKRTTILEKYQSELRDVADKCKILSQFSEQYGPEKNKFNAQPSDDLVIDMARKAYEVLLVFMTIRRERMSTSADDDTMDYIRKRRTVLSPARSKARKRSRHLNGVVAPMAPGLFVMHVAFLSKKRANEATTHFSADNTAPASAAAGAGASVTPNSASDSNTPLVLAAVPHNPPHHVGTSGSHPSIGGILSSAQPAPGPSAGMVRAPLPLPLPLPQHTVHSNYQQQHRSVPVQPASAHMAYAQQQQILPPHQPHSAPIHGSMHQEYHISQAMPHINGTSEHANNFTQSLYSNSNSNANPTYPTASNGGGNGSNPTRQRVHEHQKPVKTSISRIIG